MSQVLSGLLFINNQDVYLRYGAFLAEDRPNDHRNYNELLKPAQRKPIVEVSFGDRSGVKLPEVIPAALEAREVQLQFAIEASSRAEFMSRYSAFIGMLSAGEHGWLNIRLVDMQRTYKMYYLSCSEWRQMTHLDSGRVLAKFTVRLREPNPIY